MKLILISLALVATASLFLFCKHTRYSASDLPKEQIRFGKGGGFAGIEHAYTLLENGQLFQRLPDGSLSELKDTKKRAAKGYFKTVETLNLSNMDFMFPGNTYSFIEVPGTDGPHRISWGKADSPVPGTVQDLFRKLMQLLPESNENKN